MSEGKIPVLSVFIQPNAVTFVVEADLCTQASNILHQFVLTA